MTDLLIDDILMSKVKRKNSSDKGKRVERTLCKLLTERFKFNFSRSVGSGNRWGQVAFLPKHAQETFSGDLVVPENFKFVLESKGGYDDIDLQSIFEKGNSQLDSFVEQATFESNRSGKKPLVLWKKNRKQWLAFIRTIDLPHLNWNYRLIYRDWSIISLEALLNLPDDFFYKV